MKILILVSMALLATYVQADMPTQEEVALAKQTRICIDMGNDFKTCCEKLGDKLDKMDLVRFLSIVNYEAVLNELRDFLEVYKTGKHTIRETLAIMKQNGSNKQKRDISSKFGEIKNATIKEYEEIKASVNAAKEKLEACAKEPGKSYFSCAKEFAEQKFKETFGQKQKRDISGKFEEIKNATLKEYEEIKASVAAAKEKLEACSKEPGKSYFSCAKEFAEQKFKDTFGRKKRGANDVAWYPSAEEVAAAKQIKICLDMGKDKSECYAEVLGANIDKFDLVKLETITKYEDVLKELRQFHEIYNKGGKTIRECLLELHKQQTAVKHRAFTPQNVQDLVNLKTVVLECMAAAQENNVSKCAVALLGQQIAGTDKIAMIQQLVNHPAVQEFAKGAGQQLYAWLSSIDGMIPQIRGWAQATYDYVMSYFG